MTDDLLANLGRLVSGQTSTRSLNERREELRKSRAQSVERAKEIEVEERMKNPKFDAALKNIERFDADRRAKSLGPDSREKRVTFAPSSSSSESEGKPSKKSIATSLKQFLGFKSVGPVSPVPLHPVTVPFIPIAHLIHRALTVTRVFRLRILLRTLVLMCRLR
jgi:hypothetical protein